jgi:hypothetical protein
MSASSEPRDLEARRSLLYARDPFAPYPEPLERLGLPYCVTGSVAASVRDIRFMLAATPLDLVFVESAVTRIGLQAQWRQCR